MNVSRTTALAAALIGCAATTAPSSAQAQKAGGTLRAYHRDNPPSASLQEESTISTAQPFMAVFNNLFVYNQQSPRNSASDLTPELATEWAWNEDQTALTLKLRQGVKWHDGKPFTSADVKCTFDWITGKKESGWRKNVRQPNFFNLKEVTTNGDFEVTLKLGRPQPSMMDFLAGAFAPVYPCHVPAREMRTKPVGTGPFKMGEFKPNDTIRLVRNPDYWRPGRPYLDAVEWKIIPNRSTRVLALIAGEFDMTFVQDVTAPILRDIKAQAPQMVCQLNASSNQGQLLINQQTAPFDNAEIRRAGMLALDRKAFIDIISEGNDQVGGAMLPPPGGNWGLTPEQLADVPGYGGTLEKNREEGRKIMAGLGYGPDKPLKVKVQTRNIPLYRDPAVILIDQLKQVYIEGELEPVETSLWLTRLIRKDFTVAMNVSGFALDDPDLMFYERYSCGAELNYSGFCDPAFTARFDEQSQTTDPAKRKALVQSIDLDLQRLGVRPIIFHTRANTCWHPYVKGITLAGNSQYNQWRLEDAWLDK